MIWDVKSRIDDSCTRVSCADFQNLAAVVTMGQLLSGSDCHSAFVYRDSCPTYALNAEREEIDRKRGDVTIAKDVILLMFEDSGSKPTRGRSTKRRTMR